MKKLLLLFSVTAFAIDVYWFKTAPDETLNYMLGVWAGYFIRPFLGDIDDFMKTTRLRRGRKHA